MDVCKASFLLLLCLLHGKNSWGQIQELEPSKATWTTVGKIKWLANTRASLEYTVRGRDTTYLLYLQDEEKLKNSRDMTVLKHFSVYFDGIDDTCGKLYEALRFFFSPAGRSDKELIKTLRLGKQVVYIQHYPRLVDHAIVFSTGANRILFTEKELQKLFGR